MFYGTPYKFNNLENQFLEFWNKIYYPLSNIDKTLLDINIINIFSSFCPTLTFASLFQRT
jgi:hypothetical protein